jgi:hypothetical protein
LSFFRPAFKGGSFTGALSNSIEFALWGCLSERSPMTASWPCSPC